MTAFKQQTHRLGIFILCALLLVTSWGFTPAAQAEAPLPGANLSGLYNPPPFRINSAAQHEGTLLFADFGQVYLMTSDGQVSQTQMDALIGKLKDLNQSRSPRLVQGEAGVAVLDTYSGLLVPLVIKGTDLAPGTPVQLDWEDYITRHAHYNEVHPPVAYALSKEVLYALEGQGAPITRFDLQTGKRMAPLTTPALELLSYKDGQLLIIGAVAAEKEGAFTRAIQVLDPKADSITTIRPVAEDEAAVFTLSAIAYNKQDDILLIGRGDTLYAYPALGPGQPSADLPVDVYHTEKIPLAALPGSRAAVAAEESLFLKSTDPTAYAGKTELNLLVSATNPTGLNQAVSRAEGLRVKVTQQGMDPMDIAQMMIAGGDEYDLFWLELSEVDFDSLMKKGYAANLSNSPLLKANHDKLYPYLQQAVGLDGGIYALPVTLFATVMLGEEKIVFDQQMQPTLHTLFDMLDFMESWPDTYAEEHQGMSPFYPYEIKHFTYELALTTYINHYQGQGLPLHFDTDLMRAIFSRVEQLDYEAMERAYEGDYSAQAVFDKEWMYNLFLFSGDSRDSNTFFPFLISAKEGEPAVAPLQAGIVFINARSQKKEAAISFLETMLGVITPDSRIMMHKTDAKPVENPHFEQLIREHQARVQLQKDLIKKAPQAQQEELKRRLEGMEEGEAWIRENRRYLIKQEHIDAWQKMAGHAFVQRYNSDAQGAKAAKELLSQYISGQLTLDMYIKEVQGRLQLFQLENE